MNAPIRCRFMVWGMVLFALAATSQARMIVVYTQPGEPMALDEMHALVAAVQENPEAAASEKFTYKTAETSVLSAEFSVPPGVSALFWSDQTFEWGQGYESRGECAQYEVDMPLEGDALAKGELGVEALPQKVFQTTLRGASLNSGSLQLAYSVSKPGKLTVEAYGINGQSFGRWEWQEGSAGAFERSLPMNRKMKGLFYVRWTHGNVQAVQKVGPAVLNRQ